MLSKKRERQQVIARTRHIVKKNDKIQELGFQILVLILSHEKRKIKKTQNREAKLKIAIEKYRSKRNLSKTSISRMK